MSLTKKDLQADLMAKHPYKVGNRLKSLNLREDGFYPSWTVLEVYMVEDHRYSKWAYLVKSDDGHTITINDTEPGLCAEDYPFNFDAWNTCRLKRRRNC